MIKLGSNLFDPLFMSDKNGILRYIKSKIVIRKNIKWL